MTVIDEAMTDAIKPVAETQPIDWRRVGRSGGILAIGLVFIALTGIPLGLDARTMIDPFLSLGYLALVALVPVMAWGVGNELVLEGMSAKKRSFADVVAGAAVGAIGALGLCLLIVGIENFDIRDPLLNWSPQTLEILLLDQSAPVAMLLWILGFALLGGLAASLRLVSTRTKRAIVSMIGAVLGFAVFETFIIDLFGFSEDLLYAQRGGLKIGSVLILGGAAAAASLLGGGDRYRGAKASYAQSEGDARRRSTIVLVGVSVAALIIIPIFTGKITQELLANVGLFLLLALGLNIVVGLAGILDLGYVAFFAVGGYTTAVLTSPNRGPNWPDWVPTLDGPFGWAIALMITIVVAGFVGLFIGAPVIRMRGDYLAIVTLGFGEIIRLMFQSDWLDGYFNGAQGITNIPPADFGVFDVEGTDPRSVFYLTMFLAAIAIYVSWRLERSRLGRAWMAVREDESVAEAMGINTVNVKLMAFVVGAVLASFSGAVFSAKVGSIFPTSFLILVSIVILVVVIVGGMGNIMGVIAGSVVLIGILGGPRQPGLLAEFSEYKLLIYGALLIWMMLKRPEGLVPNVRRSRELHQDEFLQDAWLKGEVDSDEDDEAPATEVVPS